MAKVRLWPSASVALSWTTTLLSSFTVAVLFWATGAVLRLGMTSGVWPGPQGGKVIAPVAVVTQRVVSVAPGIWTNCDGAAGKQRLVIGRSPLPA
jgi:hypothetical protein